MTWYGFWSNGIKFLRAIGGKWYWGPLLELGEMVVNDLLDEMIEITYPDGLPGQIEA